MARAEAKTGTRMRRALITGGAGFVGSHLCERLLSEGYKVVCMDNLSTGVLENVAPFLTSEADFEIIDHDVICKRSQCCLRIAFGDRFCAGLQGLADILLVAGHGVILTCVVVLPTHAAAISSLL